MVYHPKKKGGLLVLGKYQILCQSTLTPDTGLRILSEKLYPLYFAYDPYFLQDSSDKTEVAGISETREHSDSVSRDSMSRESVSRESITDDSNNAVSVEDVTLTVVDAQDDENAG